MRDGKNDIGHSHYRLEPRSALTLFRLQFERVEIVNPVFDLFADAAKGTRKPISAI
ncbi:MULTISPECIES: hypothetical protein [unclassified Caballeronia]|uniref:hypothetical protein n=1 Tax=unclassified Caballeronia TaxID=2646786 RepID=UPI0020289400|nr:MULTISPECIES: hypothetical protein [unclassified Caballeronia]MDR5798490.1 hypothetical protein [Caballeronia sp. LZ008]